MENEEKLIDKLELPPVVKKIVVEEAKEEGKKELKEEIHAGYIDEFKVDAKKWFLKSKIFWVNFITVFLAILPELLSFLLTNLEFATWLKEYNTKIYMCLFIVNAYLNIYYRTKNQDKLTIKKKNETKSENDGDN